jgi:sortase A
MKRIIISILTIALFVSINIPAFAVNYIFDSGTETLGIFGKSTSYDEPIAQEPQTENVRRNKDAAYLPPPYFYGSGEFPTDTSSPYHNNLRDSGFVAVNQNLPLIGNEDNAPGSGVVTSGLLPSTSQLANLNIAPWYYADGSIGTIYISRTGKTIKIYEGENLDNLVKGTGHFASTSVWDGNVALCGHNRGSNAYFSFVKDMQIGDRVTYTTLYSVRTYELYSKEQIGEYDNSKLGYSADNILTLITCIENVPELRWAAQLKLVQ